MADNVLSDVSLCRFAVLHHTGVDEPHFDLLFETAPGSPLTTFRLSSWPTQPSAVATKLRDHRRLYLDYQGEVPGERGRVDRVDEGRISVAAADEGGWTLTRGDGRRLICLMPDRQRGDPAAWLAEP